MTNNITPSGRRPVSGPGPESSRDSNKARLGQVAGRALGSTAAPASNLSSRVTLSPQSQTAGKTETVAFRFLAILKPVAKVLSYVFVIGFFLEAIMDSIRYKPLFFKGNYLDLSLYNAGNRLIIYETYSEAVEKGHPIDADREFYAAHKAGGEKCWWNGADTEGPKLGRCYYLNIQGEPSLFQVQDEKGQLRDASQEEIERWVRSHSDQVVLKPKQGSFLESVFKRAEVILNRKIKIPPEKLKETRHAHYTDQQGNKGASYSDAT